MVAIGSPTAQQGQSIVLNRKAARTKGDLNVVQATHQQHMLVATRW